MSFSFPSKCAKLTEYATVNAEARGDGIKQIDMFLFPTRPAV